MDYQRFFTRSALWRGATITIKSSTCVIFLFYLYEYFVYILLVFVLVFEFIFVLALPFVILLSSDHAISASLDAQSSLLSTSKICIEIITSRLTCSDHTLARTCTEMGWDGIAGLHGKVQSKRFASTCQHQDANVSAGKWAGVTFKSHSNMK